MGTDLITISNHAIDYADFDFDRLGREIAARLNQVPLPKPEFYWLSRLYWEAGRSDTVREDATSLLQPWRFRSDEDYRTGFYNLAHWRHGLLCFSGPFEWEITVSPGKAEIDLLPFRYLGWVGPSEADPDRPIRTAYRKALATLVRAVGGNEVTYLADNSHLLSLFWEIDDYATMRQELLAQLGPPLTSLTQMETWQNGRWDAAARQYREDRAYLVDDFSDLNWSHPIVLTSELQKLRDSNSLFMPLDSPFNL